MTRSRLKKAAVCSGVLALLASGIPVAAATTTANLGVKALVNGACTVGVAGDLDFGPVSVTSVLDVDQTTLINVNCVSATPFNVSADGGSTANVAARKLSNGPSLIAYQLYTNAARTTVFGDGTSGSQTVAGTGTGIAQSTTVYGRIAGSRAGATPGNYSDTVIITVSY